MDRFVKGRFLLVEAEAIGVEAEAIGVEAEAVDELAAFTSQLISIVENKNIGSAGFTKLIFVKTAIKS